MKLPKPFLGRILLEVIEEDAEEFLKAKLEKETGINLKESKLQIVFGDTDFEGNHKLYKKHEKKLPQKKGKIIDLATDAFGEAYKKKYGNDAPTAQLGDIVYYIPGQAFKIDWDEKYCMIADEDIIAIEEDSTIDIKDEA